MLLRQGSAAPRPGQPGFGGHAFVVATSGSAAARALEGAQPPSADADERIIGKGLTRTRGFGRGPQGGGPYPDWPGLTFGGTAVPTIALSASRASASSIGTSAERSSAWAP